MPMAAARSPASIDLLAWPAVEEARARAEAAEVKREAAARKYRLAPHGERVSRLNALQEASHEALRADLELQTIVRESLH